MMKLGVLAIVFIIGNVHSLHLPKYIKACKPDETFDDCALKQARNAIPHIAEGDRKFRQPTLKPMKVTFLEFNAGDNFKLKFINATVYGMDTVQFNKIHAVWAENKMQIGVHVEKIVVTGDYEVDGKVGLLPLSGKGKANMTFINGDYEYDFTWAEKEKSGKTYLEIVKADAAYKFGDLKFYLGNLFNGDEVLGEQINKALNADWKILSDDMHDSIIQIIIKVCGAITSNYFSKVPKDELILSDN